MKTSINKTWLYIIKVSHPGPTNFLNDETPKNVNLLQIFPIIIWYHIRKFVFKSSIWFTKLIIHIRRIKKIYGMTDVG